MLLLLDYKRVSAVGVANEITNKITIMAEKFIQNADKVAGIIAFLLFFVTVYNAFTVGL